ncbi:tyrosine-protein kinase transmembrane receptor Ror2-like [Crassostrea virginica]
MLPEKLIFETSCKQGAVRAVRFNCDGNYCLTCGSDKSVKLWNPHRNLLLKTYHTHAYEVLDAQASCDNSQICTCGMDKYVCVTDVATGKSLRKYRGHAGIVNCVKYNEDSSVILSGSTDNSVRIWDCKSRKLEPLQILDEAKDSVTSIQVSDHEILTGSADGFFRRYDLRTGKMHADFIGKAVSCVSFTKDGQCVLVGTLDDSIKLMDKDTGEMLNEFTGHQNHEYKVDSTLNCQDTHVISGSEDGFVYYWDLVEWNRIWLSDPFPNGGKLYQNRPQMDVIDVEFIRSPKNATVEEDQRHSFHCEIKRPKGCTRRKTKVKWFHNGNKLTKGNNNFKIRRSGTALRFDNIKFENRGEYYCMVVCSTSDKLLRVKSKKAYLKVEVPVQIVTKKPNRHIEYGTSLQLSCVAKGIPTPELQWLDVNGSVINSSETNGLTITSVNIPPMKRECVLKFETVNSNMTVQCQAKNRVTSGMKVKTKPIKVVLVTSPKQDQVSPTPERPRGTCAPYNGTFCKGILGNSIIFLNASYGNPALEQDREVDELMEKVLSSSVRKPECEDAARKVFCHHIFPGCTEEASKARPIHLCKESCLAVKELLCFDQWNEILANKKSSSALPDCYSLPSKSDNTSHCIDGKIFNKDLSQVTNKCYKGTGQWYNGTVNVTKSGIPCQPWDSQYPHTHQRLPSVFPSLQGAENFCRNPGSEEDQPWCYTTKMMRRWELCDIPKCHVTFSQESPQPQNLTVTIIIIIIVIALFIFVSILMGVLCCQISRQRKHVKYDSTPQDDLDIDIDKLPTNSCYHKLTECSKFNPKLQALEYPRNSIVYIRDIGQGAFGRVFKAKAPNIASEDNEHLIAVKMLKEDASDELQQDFQREASLMVEFDHPNIVKLLGVCAIGNPMCLLFEYMKKGDLNEFLRLNSCDNYIIRRHSMDFYSEHKPSLNTTDQLYIAKQIAQGMLYLSEKGYVHRDLATRNCLVGDNLEVKISDFGLARSIHSLEYYRGSEHDAIPIRWMPPESILYNKFTVQSDVWSFGILLWELFSFALQPYYGMTHEEVVQFVKEGKILACPENTPKQVYDLMKMCWSTKPSSRPSFHILLKSLNVLYEDYQKKKVLSDLV